MIVEFYPSPYDSDDLDTIIQSFKNIHVVIIQIEQKYRCQMMYTGVRGEDCFYKIDGSIEAMEYLFHTDKNIGVLVKSVENAAIIISTLPPGQQQYHGLRVHLPLPNREGRNR